MSSLRSVKRVIEYKKINKAEIKKATSKSGFLNDFKRWCRRRGFLKAFASSSSILLGYLIRCRSLLAHFRLQRRALNFGWPLTRIRTTDTGIFSPLLYRLSYRGSVVSFKNVRTKVMFILLFVNGLIHITHCLFWSFYGEDSQNNLGA